jgi:hypothetical protein
MISPKSLRQLAAYSISLPAFAVSPKLAKETVYMPSQVAEQTLGNGAKARTENTDPAKVPVKRER